MGRISKADLKAKTKADFKAKITELHELYLETYANNRDVHFLSLIRKEIGANDVMICTNNQFDKILSDYVDMYY